MQLISTMPGYQISLKARKSGKQNNCNLPRMKFSVTKHTQFTAKENLGNITHATCREGKSWNGELSELTQEKNLRNKDDSDPGGVDAEAAPGNIRQ